MQIEDDYPGIVREISRIIRDDRSLAKARWYANAEGLAAAMRYPSHHNQPIYDLLDHVDGAYLAIRSARLLVVQKARAKEQERLAREEAKEQERIARDEAKEKAKIAKEQARKDRAAQRQQDHMEVIAEHLGAVPADEVDFINLLAAKHRWAMTYDRQYSSGDERVTAEQVTLTTHLTAAQLHMVKPRGDLLGATNIDRALAQWALGQRADCVKRVLSRISALPPGISREEVLAAHRRVCEIYYDEEPAYAAACEQKMMWQVRRMLLDMPVEHRAMLVMVGPQGSGKTFRQRIMTAPIGEMVAEASLKDVLDERQMELSSYAALLLDELVSADRADVAALKNFVTGADWARRPMRSNLIEKVKVRASLLGTSNRTLGQLIYDATGMRRFIELRVKTRAEIEPHWQEIVGFDWLSLWQAIDVAAEDPLMVDFADMVLRRQEEIRAVDNTELWAKQFSAERRGNYKAVVGDAIEYYANDLYAEFRMYEQEYDRAWRGTSLTRWGTDLKALIDANKLPGWSHRKLSAKTVYCVPMVHDTDTDQSNVTSILSKMTRR